MPGFFSKKKKAPEVPTLNADEIKQLVTDSVVAAMSTVPKVESTPPVASITVEQVVQLQKYGATLGLENLVEKCILDKVPFEKAMVTLMNGTIIEIGDMQTSQNQYNSSTGNKDMIPIIDSKAPTTTSEALAIVMAQYPNNSAKECLEVSMKSYPSLYNVNGNGSLTGANMPLPKGMPDMMGTGFDRNPHNPGAPIKVSNLVKAGDK